MICYTKGLAKDFEIGIIKMLVIIGDNGMRDSKSIDDASFNEVYYFLFNYHGKWPTW